MPLKNYGKIQNTSKKIKKSSKNCWENDNYRENHIMKMKEHWSNNENRIIHSEKIKKSWQNEKILKEAKIRTENRWKDKEYREKMVQMSKDTWNDERKKLFKEKMKGYKHKKVICPFCNKEGGETGMKRWHFNNCKFKK